MTEGPADFSLLPFGRRLLEVVDSTRKTLSFYPADHPIVVESIT